MGDSQNGFEVGYGKPPKDSRFAKGKSGNPKGRPKGSKGIAAIFHDVTRGPIHVTQNGKGRTVTKLEAIMLQLTTKAVSGDMKAMGEILKWDRIFEESADKDGTENPDREKNEAVMSRLLNRIRKGDDAPTNELDVESGTAR
jgi:hypothetical protein